MYARASKKNSYPSSVSKSNNGKKSTEKQLENLLNRTNGSRPSLLKSQSGIFESENIKNNHSSYSPSNRKSKFQTGQISFGSSNTFL